jgi:hypothetical protein
MLSIHGYELVHQEPVVGSTTEVLLMFYDQLKGGTFFILAPIHWVLGDVMPVLSIRR